MLKNLNVIPVLTRWILSDESNEVHYIGGPDVLPAPLEGEDLLGIGMQAQMHGAGMGGPFDHGLFLFGELTVGHVEDDLDLADAARVGAHGLADLDGGAGHVHAVVPAVDADDGHGAGGQGRGAKVGGAEGLALAVVVLGGVGDEHGTALLVHAFHAQVAEIFGGDVCHGGTPFLPQNALSAPRTQEVCP